MKDSDLPSVPEKIKDDGFGLPRINLLTMLRLGLYQMGLGMMALLTLGVLNRIMINELKVLPVVAALAIAMHQFVSPARIWFGQLSDSKTLWGYHRSVYVWLGAAAFTTISFITLQAIWQLGSSIQAQGWSSATTGWTLLVGGLFGLYGFALSASSTPFAALLVDITDDDNRSKLIGVVWSMLMVGIVVGAIVSSRLLEQPDVCGAAIATYNPTQANKIADIAQLRATINPAFIIMPLVVFGLSIVSTFGVERTYSRYKLRSSVVNREDQITLGKALRVLTSSRQTVLFFCFLLAITLGIFMQDAVLESFGGEVFGLCIAQTTRLNVPFAMGTLVGISGTGFLLVPRFGKTRTAAFGCTSSAFCFGLIIVAGLLGNLAVLNVALALFGLSAGIITGGATSLMLDLTLAETAGTFIGAWGLGQAIARGLATVLGGAVLSFGKLLFVAQPGLAYGTVFASQALWMLVALWFLRRVNIQEFQDTSKQAIEAVLAGEME